jgi:hypothetical protein
MKSRALAIALVLLAAGCSSGSHHAAPKPESFDAELALLPPGSYASFVDLAAARAELGISASMATPALLTKLGDGGVSIPMPDIVDRPPRAIDARVVPFSDIDRVVSSGPVALFAGHFNTAALTKALDAQKSVKRVTYRGTTYWSWDGVFPPGGQPATDIAFVQGDVVATSSAASMRAVIDRSFGSPEKHEYDDVVRALAGGGAYTGEVTTPWNFTASIGFASPSDYAAVAKLPHLMPYSMIGVGIAMPSDRADLTIVVANKDASAAHANVAALRTVLTKGIIAYGPAGRQPVSSDYSFRSVAQSGTLVIAHSGYRAPRLWSNVLLEKQNLFAVAN